MSWLYSQALVEEFLGASCSDGEPSALSSGNHTQQAYCAPDKMTVFSRLSRFGMTYKPLTESRGEELLTLYLAGFHAKTLASRGGGAGIDGERSGMWKHMARIVGEVRPRYVFVENSPALLTRGLGRVLGDLAALGYDCRWTVLGAADVGAPHQRDRFWLVGSDSDRLRLDRQGNSEERQQPGSRRQAWGELASLCGEVAHTNGVRQLQPQGSECHQWGWAGDGGAEMRDSDRQGLAVGQGQSSYARQELKTIERTDWWQSEPNVGRVAHGVAARVDRLKAIGNGQVPLCAATAWRILTS